MENWRFYVIIGLLLISLLDLVFTYAYVYRYKQWQPEKPYELIELNPLLRFLWKHFGLHLGMFVGAVIILSLNYLIARYAHPIVIGLVAAFLIYAITGHLRNGNLLSELIKMYPSGHLPKEVFGEVVGNNAQ